MQISRIEASSVAGALERGATIRLLLLAGLQTGLRGTGQEQLWPVRQLANVCRLANTQNRYIQIDEELVACRFATKGEQ